MRRVTVLLATFVGLVAALLIAAPAQAATYGVTLTVSTPNADVGQTVKLTGAVSGSKAAKKTLTVQRRVGSGAWTKIGTVKTTKKKVYSFSHRVSAVGDQQFRVVAPKKGSTKQGVSAPAAFTGWTWLWLSEQEHYVVGNAVIGIMSTLRGIDRPRSITLSPSTTTIGWTIDGCNDSDVKIGQYDNTLGSTGITFATNETSSSGVTYYATGDDLTVVDLVSSNSIYLEVKRTNASGTTAVIASPRVHCKVGRLQLLL